MVRPDATVIIDENCLFREGLKRILSATRFRVAAALREVGELKILSLNSSSAVVVLIGAGLGRAEESRSAIRDIKQRHPIARVMVLGERCDLNEVLTTFRAGADGYVLKTITPEGLIKSLDLLMLGETVLPSSILSTALADGRGKIGPPPRGPSCAEAKISEAVSASELDLPERVLSPRLSNRETAILACLTEGQSNKAIARKFGVAEATVKVHIKAILRKIRVNNRTQAAIWAVDHALRPAEHGVGLVANVVVSNGGAESISSASLATDT